MPKISSEDFASIESRFEELEAQLRSKMIIIKLIDKKILPSLKKRIEDLEKQLRIKEKEIEHYKMLQDLTKIELYESIPLPF